MAMLGCLALALAMNGWPDERNDEVQEHRICVKDMRKCGTAYTTNIGSDLSSPLVPLSATDCMRVWMRSLAHTRRRDESAARECVTTSSFCTESKISASVEV